MPGYFNSPEGDLERIFVDDYAMIDQYAKTGSLWLWGGNGQGRIGDNTTTTRSSPVQTISAGTNWKQVACGGAHTAAVTFSNQLFMWGEGSGGQLGINSTVPRSAPTLVSGPLNWQSVACGGFHTAAIRTDGSLWTWGDGNRGQLGNNSGSNVSSPVQTIAAGTNWKQVACGEEHTAAIKTDGTLWLWGQNDPNGQLGDNTIVPKSSPVQTVAGGSNWKQVACGLRHTAAIKTDGTLWLWGSGSSGPLGYGGTQDRSSPVQTIAGGTNWKQVACGYRSTAAIKTDGTLWLWGDNSYGQIGDNSIVNRASPVQTISGGTNWKQVACGEEYTAAIKTDGTLWLWGNNNYGKLGTNNTLKRSSPVQTVAGGNNWKQVSTGEVHSAAIHFYDAGNLYPSA